MDKTNALSLRGGGMFDGGWSPTWLIRDEFTDTLAAGSVDGTAATPGPGTRAVTDTESKVSVGGGVLAYSGGYATPSINGPGILWDGVSASAGIALISKLTVPASTSENGNIYFHRSAQVITSCDAGWYQVFDAGNVRIGAVNLSGIAGLSPGNSHIHVIVLQSSGALFIYRAFGESEYTVEWKSVLPTWGTVYAGSVNFSGERNIDYLRVLALPAPFDTDTGLATDVHAGSVSAGTTFTHAADALIEYTLTTRPSTDNANVFFRVQDASNYWISRVNSSGDISLVEVVAGTPTTRGTAAGVVSSGHRIVVIADDTTVRLYSNNTLRVTYASATNFATATAGELDALGTGGAISDLITWPRTLSGTAAAILDKASVAYSEPEKTTLTLYTTKSGTFNPTIVATGDPGVYWDFGDGNTYIGLTPNHSYADGSQKTVTITFDDPSLVTRLNFFSQSMTGEWPLSSLADFTALTQLVAYTNASLNVSGSLADAPAAMTYLHLDSTSSNITGSLVDAPAAMANLFLGGTSSAITGGLADAPAAMTNLQLGGTSSAITGSLADAPAGMTSLILYSTSSNITGSLADVPAPMTQLQLHGTSSAITGGATAMAAVGIRQIRVDSSSTTQANINDILLRLYTDRASFTWATPLLNVGGTNPDPSGVYQDATPPTTGLEYAYKLVVDPDTEGFNTWTVTY